MIELTQLTERDILVMVYTQVEGLKADMSEVKSDMTGLADRVTILERTQDREEGFWTGAKALWGLIVALPTGALGTVLGAWLQSR